MSVSECSFASLEDAPPLPLPSPFEEEKEASTTTTTHPQPIHMFASSYAKLLSHTHTPHTHPHANPPLPPKNIKKIFPRRSNPPTYPPSTPSNPTEQWKAGPITDIIATQGVQEVPQGYRRVLGGVGVGGGVCLWVKKEASW